MNFYSTICRQLLVNVYIPKIIRNEYIIFFIIHYTFWNTQQENNYLIPSTNTHYMGTFSVTFSIWRRKRIRWRTQNSLVTFSILKRQNTLKKTTQNSLVTFSVLRRQNTLKKTTQNYLFTFSICRRQRTRWKTQSKTLYWPPQFAEDKEHAEEHAAKHRKDEHGLDDSLLAVVKEADPLHRTAPLPALPGGVVIKARALQQTKIYSEIQ